MTTPRPHGRRCQRDAFEAQLDPGCMRCVSEAFATIRAMNDDPRGCAAELLREAGASFTIHPAEQREEIKI